MSEGTLPVGADPVAPVEASGGRAPRVESGFGEELRYLRRSPLFWSGVGVKLICAVLLGSSVATKWFAPFVYDFVHSGFGNSWEHFLARGEPLGFPYGPGMLLLLATSWLPTSFVSFDPSSHLGLLLLRLPLFVADFAICVLLMRWLRGYARNAVLAYWLSPIVIYATYIHGQLDLLPTALLCVALHCIFGQRMVTAAVIFGVALATKAHILIAACFAVIYVFRRRRSSWLAFVGTMIATTALLYAPVLGSAAFRKMVLGSSEISKVWSLSLGYGSSGLLLYVAPAAVAVALLRFASYRKLNRELTTMFLGAVYVGLVALVPPQPGWFIWSIPFVAYLGARFSRTGRFALIGLTVSYLLYFMLENPELFFQALDPTLGAGTGAALATMLRESVPTVFSIHGTSIAWTALFSSTALTALEMYRKGVRSNELYGFRDESFMIGIGGDSGAGKHTLGADLNRVLGPSRLSLINGDDDHKWERGHAMWRRYTHLDPRGNHLGSQLESLAALRRGGAIRKRHYDHDVGRFTDPVLLKPTDFIGIIGLHPFFLGSQRQLLHLKIFVDPGEKLRRQWKVARDVAKRGYTPERVLEEIERRMSDSSKYVRPQMQYADVLVRHGSIEGMADNTVCIEIELASALEPLLLVDLLGEVSSLVVDWSPNDALTRDRVKVEGELDASQVRLLAVALIPNVDELVDDLEKCWLSGGRGLVQVVILYAISARIRSTAARQEVS